MPPSRPVPKAETMQVGLSSVTQSLPPHLSGPTSSSIKSPALPLSHAKDHYIAAAMPPAALKSLAFHDQSKELQGITAERSGSGSLVLGQSDHKSGIESLCFNTAAMSVAAPASEESAHRLEGDCRSSTSENSSVHAFEVQQPAVIPVLSTNPLKLLMFHAAVIVIACIVGLQASAAI